MRRPNFQVAGVNVSMQKPGKASMTNHLSFVLENKQD